MRRAGRRGSDADRGDECGFPFQVLNLVQSYLTLRVPLFVSYLFHSPAGPGGWQHFDLKAELRLTFVYDTAILWDDGIGSPPGAELQGGIRTWDAPGRTAQEAF